MHQRLSYARSWAFLLLWLSGTITQASLVAVAFNEKLFLSSESGASALDARSNPMIVGPRPVTAGFAELGCNLLAQTSRVHALDPVRKWGGVSRNLEPRVSKVACREGVDAPR